MAGGSNPGGAASRQVVREVVRCVVRGIGGRVRLREGGGATPSRTTTALATYTRRAPGSTESGPCRRRGLRQRNCGELLPPQGRDPRLFRLAQRLARGARSGRALSSSRVQRRPRPYRRPPVMQRSGLAQLGGSGSSVVE